MLRLTSDSSIGPGSISAINYITTPATPATSSPMIHISYADLDQYVHLKSTLIVPHVAHTSSSSMDTYVAFYIRLLVINSRTSSHMTYIRNKFVSFINQINILQFMLLSFPLMVNDG